MITERFNERLTSQSDNDTPSCSVAEALDKQDLFINPAIANLGASLFWQFLRNGMTTVSRFLINLSTFQAQPVKISCPAPTRKISARDDGSTPPETLRGRAPEKGRRDGQGRVWQ